MAGGPRSGAPEVDAATASREPQAIVDRSRRLSRLVQGYQLSAAIGVVVRLGVVQHLRHGEQGIDELAAACGADPDALRRVMRLLTHVEVFDVRGDGRFALGELGTLLLDDALGSQAAAARYAGSPWHWSPYAHLEHAVRTGRPAFPAVHNGRGVFEFLAEDAVAGAEFAAAMRGMGDLRKRLLLRRGNLDRSRVLVDLGGGDGHLMTAALEAHPHLRGVVLEREPALTAARDHIATSAVAERCTAQETDFLTEVPSVGDTYLLAWVLDDWPDDQARRILANCRSAMQDGDRLLILEYLLGEGGADELDGCLDLEMLVVFGGRERTRGEFTALLADAGLELVTTRKAPLLPWRLLEARRARTASMP